MEGASRTLKRRFSQPDGAPFEKRQKTSLLPPTISSSFQQSKSLIEMWLDDLVPLPQLQRRYSDSALLTMANKRSATRPRRASSDASMHQQPGLQEPITPISLQMQSGGTIGGFRVPAAPASASGRSGISKVTSVSASSNGTKMSLDDPKKSKRVSSPTYRVDDLADHGVYVDSHGSTMPTLVRSYAEGIINKVNNTEALNDAEVNIMKRKIHHMAQDDETSTQSGFSKLGLFPNEWDYEISNNVSAIATGSDVSFDRTGLPYIPDPSQPRGIVTAKPDLHYGYPRDSFCPPQAPADVMHVLNTPRIHPFARPNTTNYWPFFAIEFKSRSRLGSLWVAENQNAATGAHCVNSLETLLHLARSDFETRCITESIAFSCAVDCDLATMWVHWRELPGDNPIKGTARFVSAELAGYQLKRVEDIRGFGAAVRNVIDWGIGERLDMLRSALVRLVPEVPRWIREDTEARKRRAEDEDVASYGGS